MAAETEQLQLDRPTLRLGVAAVLDARVPGRYWVAESEGRVVGQLLITYEWSDWRNRQVWWIQSVHVAPEARRLGVFRALYAHLRREAQAAGAGGLRLYVDETNGRAQAVYASLGNDRRPLPRVRGHVRRTCQAGLISTAGERVMPVGARPLATGGGQPMGSQNDVLITK